MKHILEFNKYDKSGRGESLSEDEFKYLLKENCSDWLESPSQLVRFKKESSDEFYKIQPSIYNRMSLNHDNYIVMLMDNLPSWFEFPKRSESIIFYNSNYHSDFFGNHLYFIIPFDKSNFGKAPSDDLWQSRHVENSKIALDKRFSRGFFNIHAPIEYDKFSTYMNVEFIKKDFGDNKMMYTEFLEMRELFYKSIDKYKNFMEFLNEYLSPIKFRDIDNRNNEIGYKSVNYKGLISNNFEDVKECWTDSDCLIYYAGETYDSYNVNKKYYKFINNLGI